MDSLGECLNTSLFNGSFNILAPEPNRIQRQRNTRNGCHQCRIYNAYEFAHPTLGQETLFILQPSKCNPPRDSIQLRSLWIHPTRSSQRSSNRKREFFYNVFRFLKIKDHLSSQSETNQPLCLANCVPMSVKVFAQSTKAVSFFLTQDKRL